MKTPSIKAISTFLFFTTFTSYQIFSFQQFDNRLMSNDELIDLIEESKKPDTPFEKLNENEKSEIRSISHKKKMTFMVYIAGDNDLHYFAWKNIKQMEQIGSNENITILVQLNTPGHLNPTKRYIIKKGKRLLVQDPDSPNQKLNSGNPYTLIDFAEWATTHFPADYYALDLWNHASGAAEPSKYSRTVNPCELFYCNPSNNMLEIDRSLSYLGMIAEQAMKINKTKKKGICFDETFKDYITNRELEFALNEIHNRVLNGKKLSILAFDACLMSMIEIANLAKDHADYMVGSQEVEYGTGWNYETVLRPFLQNDTPSPKEFAIHIVNSYEKTYQKVTNEYTQSAIDLSFYNLLDENVSNVSIILTNTIHGENKKKSLNTLRKCKSLQHCTCFEEPTYIDLGHFYKNLLNHSEFLFNQECQEKTDLERLLRDGLSIIKEMVIQNKVGQKLKNATGLSIYFPEVSIGSSYSKSPFSLSNYWGVFLTKYILR